MQKIIDAILIIIMILSMIAGLYLWHHNRTFSKEKIDALFEPITSKYGVKIVYEIENDFFSPLEDSIIPAGPDRGSNVELIRHQVLLRYPIILQKTFEKYPIEIIKKYLNAIHFAGKIEQAGFNYGGSYDPFRRIIYLVDNGGNNDDQAMGTFHHEFSSLLMKRHSFLINPWTDYNPANFKYLSDTSQDAVSMSNNTSLIGTEDDYKKGFMNSYGQTDFGNDFSEYSAMIFTHPQKFKKIMGKYPRVRGKFKVWLKFHHDKIDQIFTEEYLFGEALSPNGK